MKAREVNKRIEALGGRILRQKGSHRLYSVSSDGATGQTTVPQHTGDIPIGLLRKIEKDLELVLGKGWLR
ncbi:type II toxin-antitoxin system HicA family toxin [Homoserinimonas sp. A520]